MKGKLEVNDHCEEKKKDALVINWRETSENVDLELLELELNDDPFPVHALWLTAISQLWVASLTNKPN